MKMLFRYIYLLLVGVLVVMPIEVGAQSRQQTVIVKTRGKQTESGKIVPGKHISGAYVKIKNGNVHKSNSTGKVIFPVPTGKYAIKSVEYTDKGNSPYQLVDLDVLSKVYNYSSTPHDIVIASSWEIDEDKYAEEQRMRQASDQRYRVAQEEIKKLESSGKVSADSIQKLRNALNESRELEEKMIKSFAEKYAKIDFDRLSDFDREFALYIRIGQLERADSMLNTCDDLESQKAMLEKLRRENMEGRAVIDEAEARLQTNKKRQAENEQSEHDYMMQVAEYCMKQFEVSLLKNQPDSAAYYIEERASLDPNNTDWQIDAAYYLFEYRSENYKSIDYYENALKNIIKRDGEDNETVAVCYQNIGVCCNLIGNYDKALASYLKALEIKKVVFGENHAKTLVLYINIGNVYFNRGDYLNAVTYYIKCASLVDMEGSDASSMEEKQHIAAVAMQRMGSVYFNCGYISEAINSYGSALEISHQILETSDNESLIPDVFKNFISSITGLGDCHYANANYLGTIECYSMALDAFKNMYGERNNYIVEMLLCLGNAETMLGNYSTALQYYNEGLSVIMEFIGDKNKKVAVAYGYLGNLYYRQGDLMKSLEYLSSSVELMRTLGLENDYNMVDVYCNMGSVYSEQGDYESALMYCNKSLDIILGLDNEKHYMLVYIYKSISEIYSKMGDDKKSKQFLRKAEEIKAD